MQRPFASRRPAQTPLRTIGEALSGNRGFAALNQELARRASLADDLAATLPDYLRASVAPAALQDGVLVLLAGHNALAARLRHLEPRIVGALQARGWSVRGLRMRVSPLPARPAMPPKTARLSPTALACLESLARDVEESPLRDALQRLLRRYPARR